MTTTSFQEIDWYDTPRYYDLVFDVDTVKEADFLEALGRLYGTSRGRRALEPACGSGRLVVELARRGWRVQASDLNPRMVAYTRERLATHGLSARVGRADMSDFRTRGQVDLAHCLVSTFKYLLTEAAARAHLECVAEALARGGLYVLGFHLTEYAETARTRERWVVEGDGARVVCNIQGWPAERRKRTEQVRSRLVVEEGGETRRSETLWTFRTYDARQVRRLLRSVPALEHVATYDFTYDLDAERELDDTQLDTVLVLRRV